MTSLEFKSQGETKRPEAGVASAHFPDYIEAGDIPDSLGRVSLGYAHPL